MRGTVDVGSAVAVGDGESVILLPKRRLQPRTLKTAFGAISIDRIGYGGRGHHNIRPLDADLHLPEHDSSNPPD